MWIVTSWSQLGTQTAIPYQISNVVVSARVIENGLFVVPVFSPPVVIPRILLCEDGKRKKKEQRPAFHF